MSAISSLCFVAFALASPEPDSTLPPEGTMPFEQPAPPPSGATPDQPVAPFDEPAGDAAPATPPPVPEKPLGDGPARRGRRQVDPKRAEIVRYDFMLGPLWRIRQVDTAIMTSVEYGKMHGLSGSFATGMLIVTQRDAVRAFDFPIGVGAVARARARKHPLFVSLGLFAGILVHRGKTDQGVVHRVDPDFRLPLRFAWTIATVGLSLALEQGYSVRNRTYERRGVTVWERHAYRIGFVLGLHSDFMTGRSTMRRSGHRRSRR